MKNIFLLPILLLVLSAAVSAQSCPGGLFRKNPSQRGFHSGRITNPERRELRKDAFRYKMLRRRAFKDGQVTPLERRKLARAGSEGRYDLFLYKHNRSRRVI